MGVSPNVTPARKSLHTAATRAVRSRSGRRAPRPGRDLTAPAPAGQRVPAVGRTGRGAPIQAVRNTVIFRRRGPAAARKRRRREAIREGPDRPLGAGTPARSGRVVPRRPSRRSPVPLNRPPECRNAVTARFLRGPPTAVLATSWQRHTLSPTYPQTALHLRFYRTEQLPATHRDNGVRRRRCHRVTESFRAGKLVRPVALYPITGVCKNHVQQRTKWVECHRPVGKPVSYRESARAIRAGSNRVV